MKYMLMICGDESSLPAMATEGDLPGCDSWTEEMTRRGVFIEGRGLRPTNDATTVRVRANDVLISDGPFAETKDQIGGYCLVDCANLDEAIEVAAKHPSAALGVIEIRPILPS